MSGKAGRSGPRPTPGAAEVVPLFRAGLRPVDIVKRVKLCRQRVCQILTAAGLDPKGRAAATRQDREEQVCRLWQARRGRQAIADRIGLTVLPVTVCLRNLRRRGVALPPRPPMPRPKTAAVEELFRRGLTAAAIIARGVATDTVVYDVRRRMGERGELDYRATARNRRPRTIGRGSTTSSWPTP